MKLTTNDATKRATQIAVRKPIATRFAGSITQPMAIRTAAATKIRMIGRMIFSLFFVTGGSSFPMRLSIPPRIFDEGSNPEDL